MREDSAARTVRRVVGHGPELLARVRARTQALTTLNLASVVAPSEVSQGPGGEIVVALPRRPGIDLAELASRRPPLSVAECVWLGVQIGDALRSMHAGGVVHGDLAPANILVNAQGVVLLDTIGGCLEHERGTPGFRAPERAQGATGPGDVYSWGAILRWCSSPAARGRIEAWTAPMLAEDAAERPPVEVAVRALRRCATGVAVAVPAADDLVAATRARAADRTERIAEGRRWRAARWAVRGAGGLAAAACAAGIMVGVPRVVDAALPSHAPEVVSGGTAAAQVGARAPAIGSPRQDERPDAAAAAIALTAERTRAVGSGDATGLRAIPAAGTARAELDSTADALESGQVAYEGLAVDVQEAHVTRADAQGAVVDLAYVVSGHVVVSGDERREVEAFTQHVTMELRWSDGWTVASVSARE